MIRFKSLLLMLSLGYLATTAQVADKKNAVDFTPWDKPDYSLVSKAQSAKSKSVGAVRPDHVDNGKTIYFTPVFNQDNGSCGSAALIAYQMAHELNAYRGTDGSLEHNMLPTHFTWLLTYGNSSKEEMAKANGVPPVDVYGGRTYSRQLGSYDWDSPDAGWMQGYDKWYAAMSNRITEPLWGHSGEGRWVGACRRCIGRRLGKNSFDHCQQGNWRGRNAICEAVGQIG